MEEKKLTAGELSAAKPDILLSPRQAAEEMLSEYFKGLEKAVEEHLKLPIFKDHDFYLAVIQKRELILSSLGKATLRHKVLGFLACPRPEYGMNVYKYHNKSNNIEELWLLSPKDVCKRLHQNKLNLSDAKRVLLRDYYRLKTGELYNLMKTLNNEKEDSPQLKNFRKD